jgi:Fe-S-cluster containining protein
MTRLSARERLELERQDGVLLARPIWTDGRVLAAYTRQVLRLMRGRRSPSPSTDVTLFLADAFARSIDALTPPASKKELACRSGCAYCCAQSVVATPMEIFALAGALRARGDGADKVRAAADKVRGRSLQAPWIPCPLLDEGNNCTAYALRPMSCHGYASINVQDCIKTFVMRDKPSTQCPKSYNEVLTACRTVLVAALKLSGRPSDLYELNTALVVALAADDSEARWRDGADIFAGLATMNVDPELDARIARFAADLAATV